VGGHGEHEGLDVHADVEGDGFAEPFLHADEAHVRCVEEFEVAEHGAHASGGIVAGDAHYGVHRDGAFDLASAVVAVKCSGVVVVGIGGYAVLDVVRELLAHGITCDAGGHVDEPGLNVAIGWGPLGEFEYGVERFLGDGFVKESAYGVAVANYVFEACFRRRMYRCHEEHLSSFRTPHESTWRRALVLRGRLYALFRC